MQNIALSKWRRVLVPSIALLTVLLALLGLDPAAAPSALATTHSEVLCPASRVAFLTTGDLGAFTLMVNLPYTKPPWKGFRPGAPVPLFYTHYRKGRIVGYIANIALHGPDVAAERARERRLGYRGKWPLVPLQGPVVAHNPGLLEVYETIHDFTSVKAAHQWVNLFRDSGKPYPNTHWTALPPGGRDGVAWAGTMGPDKPSIEHVVSFHVRYGDRVLELALQGGSAVGPTLAEQYWALAYHHFTASCP